MSAPSPQSTADAGTGVGFIGTVPLGRRLPAVLSVLVLAIVLLALAAAPASAANGRPQIGVFGPDGTPNSHFQRGEQVAFDQAAKRLYVVDTKASKIFGFDASSAEAPIPLSGNFPISVADNSASYFDGFAVDNTSLGTAGNIYFASSKEGKIFGFDSSGNPLGGNFPISLPGPSAVFNGLGVDSEGNLWVGDSAAKIIREYSAAGIPQGTPIDTASVGRPLRIAFDSNGDAYMLVANYDQGFSLNKFTAASGYTAHTKINASYSGLNDFTVSTVSHDVFLTLEKTASAEAFDSNGTLLYPFGATIQGSKYRGIAVDEADDDLFVLDMGASDAEESDHQQIVVFGPYGPEIGFTLGAATGVTGTQATVNGSINPEGATITECFVEYGLSKSYGKSAPCSGSLPADTVPHPVSASLSGLSPQSTVYHFRFVVKTAIAKLRSSDGTFATANTFFTEAADVTGDTTATVKGKVNLEGLPLSDCRFEYGVTPLYGASKPCVPAAGSIPVDSSDHAVSADLTGLASQGTYHYRLVVSNAAGTFAGDDRSLTALGPPLVTEEEGAPVGTDSATLLARVDPRGSATEYHFDWGTDSSYGNRFPAAGNVALGSTEMAQGVSTELSGLAAATSFHFRVVAVNDSGETRGADQVFSTPIANASCPNAATREAQTSPVLPAGSTLLPSCMALEMVSPVKKYNQRSETPEFSPNGNRVQFWGEGALSETPSMAYVINPYVSSRGSTGWNTQYVNPPAEISDGYSTAGIPCAYSSDLLHWVTWGAIRTQAAVGTNVAYRGTLGAPLSPIGPPVTPLTGGVAGDGGLAGGIRSGTCEGASADASRLFFSIYDATYLAGDPQPSADASLIDYGNVYEAYLDGEGQPTVRLLQRDYSGQVYGGTCGAQIGGGRGNQVRYRGTVSPDASRVYFSARPSQAEGVPCDVVANKLRIMQRLETPSGPSISQLFSSECTRVSPSCSSLDGDDEFQGASQEGEKVYFTTVRQLADTDLDTSADLYLYDASRPGGERLTQVSAGDSSDPSQGEGAKVLGLADFSGDGSHAYFVAKGTLTTAPNEFGRQAELGEPNLYLYERDASHPAGSTAFIGTLAPGDENTWLYAPGERNEAKAVPRLGSNVEDLAVGGDGHVLVFASRAALSGDDQDGGQLDVYRYDSSTGLLERVTKADPGGSDNGAFSANFVSQEGVPGAQSVSFGREVSEDGRTIVFSSEENLSSGDPDNGENPYIWRDGSLTALPVHDGDPRVSMSGEEVAFTSTEKLLPQDGDVVSDVYVARAGGGFPIVIPPPPCDGEACQAGRGGQPADQGAASAGATSGNVKESAGQQRCGKKSVRKHGRCVKRHQTRKHRQQAKRAGHEQGGQK